MHVVHEAPMARDAACETKNLPKIQIDSAQKGKNQKRQKRSK